MIAPKFELGKIVLTPGTLEALTRAGQDAEFFVEMHAQGCWGDVAADDQAENERALREGGRLVSLFMTLKGDALLVITEADRSFTTVLTPDEY
jgi:hypothetical protein